MSTLEFIEAAQVDEAAKDKWGWNRKEDYSVAASRGRKQRRLLSRSCEKAGEQRSVVLWKPEDRVSGRMGCKIMC